MYTTEDAAVFSNSNESAKTKVIIPKGTQVYVARGNSVRSKVKWYNYSGWISNSMYSNHKPVYLVTTAVRDSSYIEPIHKVNDYRPSSSSGGTVQVKGYYRKNGTYVRPHTRSTPRRK